MGLTGSDHPRAGAGRRVFISHTSELREFPAGMSYVAAVERAVSAAGHVIVDMADFPAADHPAAQVCAERVQSCDVYVGVLGTRYGSLVRGNPRVSYTELEFDAATEAALDRLVFLLDTEAANVGIPVRALIDQEFAARQEAFRRRVRDSGLVTGSFASPAELGQLVERSLRDLAGREGRRAGGATSLPVRLAPRPVFLVGREGLLAELHAQLTASGRPGPRLVALCGLGGAGKTSVAVEYAHRQLAEVGVCWQFAAEDPALLAAEFAVLAAQLEARDVADGRDAVASVHAVLARAQSGWLLVFDNAVDRASVERFVPPAGNGRVLVTTQSQHWPPGQALDVPVLDTEVAADFLVNRTGDPDRAAAWELAETLGGLPLALEQAAAYMQATGTTLAVYLPLFRERQADLLARGEAAGHPLDVAATLGLALSRLAGQAPAAAGLLRLLAFLAPEQVPLALLLASGQAARQLGREVAAAIGPLLGDPVAAGDAVAALRRYSLVTPAGDGLVLVHRLVQAITRAQLTAEAADQWEQAAAALVEQAVPSDAELPAGWPACAVLLPHARVVLDPTSGGIWRIAEYLGRSGSYSAARDLFGLIADAYTASVAYGVKHPETLDARSNLARWGGEAGDAAGARDQFSALLPVWEQVLGPEHPRTLAARHHLARFTGEAGDAAGARDQVAALLPITERVLGRDHPRTLAARHEFATWDHGAGDAVGHRGRFVGPLPIDERVSGPEHPDTLAVRHSLAYWAGVAGDAAGAHDLFAALLVIRERVQGPEHPGTLAARHELAAWVRGKGDAAGARDLFAALLPVIERVQGPDHPDTLAVRHNFAYWAGEAGDAAGARDLFAALLLVRERVQGADHPDTLAAHSSLARFTGVAGDAAGARDQFAALLPARERVLGPEHPETLAGCHGLAYWAGVAGDAAGARDRFVALLPVIERVQNADHPHTLAVRHSLAYWAGVAGDAAGGP
jgi:hypothetical protein